MKYTSDIKGVKEFGLAKSVLYNFVLAIFITLALAVLAIYAFGLRLDVVLSDSMSPVFYKNDIVIIRSYDDYKEGDIIEYQMSEVSKPVTHRIETKIGSGKNAIYKTKGDVNENGDLTEVTHDKINGKVIAIIENGNDIYKFVKTNYFLFIDILLGIWVLTSVLSSETEMLKHNIAKI
ncbi:MAG: signal peptidase I [Clostridia bacterium]|nr:signal peptidase I [Clostridia bacterium]